LITLTRRSLSVSRALHVLSSCVLMCLAPPAVDLLEALDLCMCTRRACCFRLRISHFCWLLLPLSFVLRVGVPSLSLAGFMLKAVRRGSLSFSWFVVASAACVHETGLLLLFAYIALLLLPLSFVLGVGAPSLSLVGFIFVIEAVRRGSSSFSWFVVASAACVYETGMLLVCACRTSAASVEPLPRGSRAVAFPLCRQVLSCATWLIVRCCIKIYSSSCFGFIGANSN